MNEFKVHVSFSYSKESVSSPQFAIEQKGNIVLDSMSADDCRQLMSCLEKALSHVGGQKS